MTFLELCEVLEYWTTKLKEGDGNLSSKQYNFIRCNIQLALDKLDGK